MKNQIKTLGGGGIKSLNPHHAFTLAEVLITLAIIGIVAALTIPTLVSKNQNKQLYTGFMKTYNTIVNAFNMAIAENGDPSTWQAQATGEEEASKEVFDKYIAPHLKIVKTCGPSNYSDCIPVDSYKSLGSTDDFDLGAVFNDFTGMQVANLADGSTVMVWSDAIGIDHIPHIIYFDTNGAKGPNLLGRDLFEAVYEAVDDNKYLFLPGEEYETDYNGQTIDEYGKSYDNCNPTSDNEENGYGCASRLLKEGAMNY